MLKSGIAQNGTHTSLAYLSVSIAAFLSIFLEIITFHASEYLASYADAMMAIAIALIGISVGSLLASLFRNKVNDLLIGSALTVASVMPILVYFILVHFSSSVFKASFILSIPFIINGFIISYYLSTQKSSLIYAADLVGAGLGAIFAALSIGWFREEGSLFFVAAASAVVVLLIILFLLKGLLKAVSILPAAVFIISSVFFYQQLHQDKFNFVHNAEIRPGSGGKVFRNVQRGGEELFFSHSSIAGRVDATTSYNRGRLRAKVYNNGRNDDSFKFKTTRQYENDPRVPYGYLNNPDTFIIGTSAEGIVNSVAGSGSGKIYGVEIVPGKVKLMQTDKAKEFSYNAYQHIDELKIMDARNYLLGTDRKFDQITLMNSHMGGRSSRAAAPEYTHTADAVEEFLDHLNPGGLLNIEEVDEYGKTSRFYNIRFTSTVLEALRRRGIEDPGKHLYIFKWEFYMQFFIQPEPFTDEQLEFLDNWLLKMGSTYKRLPFIITPSVVWHPKKPCRGSIPDMILSEGNYKAEDMNLTPITDDKPFSFYIRKSKPIMMSRFNFTLVGVLLIMAIIVSVCCMKSFKKMMSLTGAGLAMIASLLGFAYLMVEIVMMQHLQLYLGSPTASLIIIVGGMLILSGIGSYVSERIQLKFHHVIVIIAVLSVLSVKLSSILLAPIAGLPLPLKMFLTLLYIAPLSILMGMPFPMVLKEASVKAGWNSIPILFALNGIFSALATPATLIIAMDLGFMNTLYVASGFYFICGALIFKLCSNSNGGGTK